MSRLLIVDDEPNMRAMLLDILEGEGHEAVACGEAEEALELLSHEPFDAGVIDLNLPGISGMEMLRRLKDRTSPIPLIMITAYGTIDAAVEAMRLGAYDFIIKPFDVSRIVQTVSKCLESAQLVSQINLSGPQFMDRSGNVLGEVSPRRYFCNQCHVSQVEAKPLVPNDFRDIAEVLGTATGAQRGAGGKATKH